MISGSNPEPMNYRLLIAMDVVEFLERLPSRTRKSIRNSIAAIGNEPLAMSDAADFDDTGGNSRSPSSATSL